MKRTRKSQLRKGTRAERSVCAKMPRKVARSWSAMPKRKIDDINKPNKPAWR